MKKIINRLFRQMKNSSPELDDYFYSLLSEYCPDDFGYNGDYSNWSIVNWLIKFYNHSFIVEIWKQAKKEFKELQND